MKHDFAPAVASIEDQLRLMTNAPLFLQAVEHLLPLAERELIALEPIAGEFISTAMQQEFEACRAAVAAGRKALDAITVHKPNNLRVMQAVNMGDFL